MTPMLRRTRHQEHWRAVETHYGPPATRIYGPTDHAIMIGGTAQLALRELIYRCYHRRASPLSVTTTGRAEQPEDGPRRRRRLHPHDWHYSVAGRPEQLADLGRSDLELRGLNDHATTGSGTTRQSDPRDSEPLIASVDEALVG